MVKHNFIKTIPMLVGAAFVLLAGAASCSKAAESAAAEQTVRGPVRIVLQAGAEESGTKAELVSGRYLSWKEGDQLVVADAEKGVLGFLSCTGVTPYANGGNTGTFEGEVEGISTPEKVNIFFVGNQSVEIGAAEQTFDFSKQSGLADKIASYLFLKQPDVVLKEQDGVYKPDDKLTFQGVSSFLKLNLDIDGTPAKSGYKAKSVQLAGLMNQLKLNYKTGEVTAEAKKDKSGAAVATIVAPGSASSYALNYVVAVIPQTVNGMTLQVSYQSDNVNGTMVNFGTYDWTLAAGKTYSTNGKLPVYLSVKPGYDGASVDGDTSDGTSIKNGYAGENVDGTADVPTGRKDGYGGTEVIE